MAASVITTSFSLCMISLLISLHPSLASQHTNVTPRSHLSNHCAYTFYVPQGAGGHCRGQEVEQALDQLREVTSVLRRQVTSLLGHNTALQEQVATLMADNGGLRQRITALEGGRPQPCEPGTPGQSCLLSHLIDKVV